MDVTGVSGWVLLQIAIGVLVAASWCYVRRSKKVKGGQPRLSVKIDAVTELPAAICWVHAQLKRAYVVERSSTEGSEQS